MEYLHELSHQLGFFFSPYSVYNVTALICYAGQMKNREGKKVSVSESLTPFICCFQLYTLLPDPLFSRPSWDFFSISIQYVI